MVRSQPRLAALVAILSACDGPSEAPRSLATPTVAIAPWIDGFAAPIALVDDGEGQLYVVDRAGLAIGAEGPARTTGPPFADLRDRLVPLDPGDARGLAGFAFHPIIPSIPACSPGSRSRARGCRPATTMPTACPPSRSWTGRWPWTRRRSSSSCPIPGAITMAWAQCSARTASSIWPSAMAADGETLASGTRREATGRIADEGVEGEGVVPGQPVRTDRLPGFDGHYLFGAERGPDGDGVLFLGVREADGWRSKRVEIQGVPTAGQPVFSNPLLGGPLLGIARDSAGDLYVLTTDEAGPAGDGGRILRLLSAEE